MKKGVLILLFFLLICLRGFSQKVVPLDRYNWSFSAGLKNKYTYWAQNYVLRKRLSQSWSSKLEFSSLLFTPYFISNPHDPTYFERHDFYGRSIKNQFAVGLGLAHQLLNIGSQDFNIQLETGISYSRPRHKAKPQADSTNVVDSRDEIPIEYYHFYMGQVYNSFEFDIGIGVEIQVYKRLSLKENISYGLIMFQRKLKDFELNGTGTTFSTVFPQLNWSIGLAYRI